MTTTQTHKLVRQGKGERLWGQCSCGGFAWLGTYELPKGRLAKLRTAHTQHVESVAEYASRGLDQYGRPEAFEAIEARATDAGVKLDGDPMEVIA